MTTRILTGTYSAGYSLSPNYSALYIAVSAEIGGTGLVAPAPATVTNAGTILANAAAPEGALGSTGIDLQSGGQVVNFGDATGGQGGSSYYRPDYGYTRAGAGGAGVSVAAGGGVVNHGVATGGAGGAGGVRDLNGDAANGGAGGYGIGLSDGGAAANGGLLTGGEGGAGGDGGPTSFFGGAGGGGAAGVEVTAAAGHITNNKGVIVGGRGGAGGKGQYNGGFGGYGGAGVFALAGAGVINNGDILGGMGGLGGATADHYNPSGYGGGGGGGVVIEGGASLDNGGTIAGGQGAAAAAGAPFQGPGGGGGAGGEGGGGIGQYVGGGAGGYGIFLDGVAAVLDNEGAVSGGAGGDCGYDYHADVGSPGGDGIVFSASGSLLNTGTVTGGHGGAGGTGPKSAVGAGGVGGVGIYLRTGATLTNRGTIAGGQGGAGPGPAGARGNGVVMAAGGSVANAAGSLIEGAVGVYVAGGAPATVINAGAITGDLNSVKFAASGGLLIAQTGARFVGAIAGSGGTFDLAGGTGTISGLGGLGVVSGSVSATFGGFANYVIGDGRWTLAGVNAVARDQSLIVDGALAVTGALSLAYTRANLDVGAGGKITFSGRGNALSGTIAGAGTVSFTAGSVTFNSSTLSAAQMIIDGAAVTLKGTVSNSGDLTIETDTLAAGGANLINQAGGTIAGSGRLAITLATGVVNNGLLEAAGGGLTVTGVVSGSGHVVVNGGTLAFASAFSQNVTFGGTSEVLRLARSQGYRGKISGFSTSGATALDLRDIAFVSAGEASFSGTATSGVLTVSDGTHTAKITLIGDYRAATFTASSDGRGGVSLVDPAKPEVMAAPTHRFIAAMAGFAGSAGSTIYTDHAGPAHEPMLSKPRAMIA